MGLTPQSTAFLFPGQGSQEVGMGMELAAKYPAAASVFSEADELVGFSLSRLCWEGPADRLNDTVNTQPAILVHSVAALRALESEIPGVRPAAAAGHSLGEYSALVAAESMSFPDALRLVLARGKAMKAAGERSPGRMAAVLGLDPEMVDSVCSEVERATGEVVQLANDNCPGQLVISGSETGMDAASERLKSAGARRVIPLAVSIAAHSALMEPAQTELNHAIETTQIRPPVLPIYANVSAHALSSEMEVREELKAQLTSKVRWTESIQSMVAAGIDSFVELGPKDIMAKLCGRIDAEVRAFAISDPVSLQNLPA